MPGGTSKEFTHIDKHFQFLQAIKTEDLVCRYPTCDAQAPETQRHEHVASRDAVLYQDPRHDAYPAIFRRWITLSFCPDHQKHLNMRHKKSTQRQVTLRMLDNIQVVVSQLRQYFLADCQMKYVVPGSWSDTIHDHDPDSMTEAESDKTLERDRKRFDPSCISLAPSDRARKSSSSFRASVLQRLSGEERKSGFIYMIYSRRVADDEEQIVKIGFSTAKPKDRIRNYGRNCNLLSLENTTWDGREVFEAQCPKRVEALIHAELRHYGHAISHECPGHGEKTRSHREFFQISKQTAMATLRHWITWISGNGPKPYDEQGNFRAWTSLWSPNVSMHNVKNSFLLDSRGKSWYTHNDNHDSSKPYCKCEVWQVCSCKKDTVRIVAHEVSESEKSAEDSDYFARNDLERTELEYGDGFGRRRSSNALATVQPYTPVKRPTNPRRKHSSGGRQCSVLESPPPLESDPSCSTPYEDDVITPPANQQGDFHAVESQDSFKSAPSQPETEDSGDDGISVVAIRAAQASKNHYQLSSLPSSRNVSDFDRDTLITPTKQRKVSQTKLDKYGYRGSPSVTETRQRSVSGINVAELGERTSKTSKARKSSGV